MLISVRHITRYLYNESARYSLQSLRLTPSVFDGQRILDWSIKTPGIDRAVRFRDAYGNVGHLVAIATPTTSIELVAEGTIEIADRAGIVKGLVEVAPTRVFVRVTPVTVADERVKALAKRAVADSRLETLHRLMEAVHGALEYEVGVTHAHTSAAEALADGKGVCQDHAHLYIAAARSLGIPARYVNGYLLTDEEGAAEAAHAWAEAWCEGIGWIGFDPVHRMCPTERYVRLACGLDAQSAAPIRGSRSGGATETLDVVVEVQQQNSQQ